MSVRSTTFGSVRLTGEDAKKFTNQVKNGRPRQEAIDSYKRGSAVAQEFKEKGYATLSAIQTHKKAG